MYYYYYFVYKQTTKVSSNFCVSTRTSLAILQNVTVMTKQCVPTHCAQGFRPDWLWRLGTILWHIHGFSTAAV